MCKVRLLRTLVKQRLNVAVEEIFELFERTIAEYEEELCRTREENGRQRERLNAVLDPCIELHKPDTQKMLKEEVPSEKPAEPPRMKDDGEQPQDLKEKADIHKAILTGVDIQREEDESRPSRLHHSQSEETSSACATTEANGELCEDLLSEPDSLFAPISDTDDILSNLSDTDDSCRSPKRLKTKKTSKIDTTRDDDYKPFENRRKAKYQCSECGKFWNRLSHLKTHMLTHTGEKPFACLVCGKRFSIKQNMKRHMAIHTGEKPHSCWICAKGFYQRFYLDQHMLRHSDETNRPYKCSVCAERFDHSRALNAHMNVHAAKKRSVSISTSEIGWSSGL